MTVLLMTPLPLSLTLLLASKSGSLRGLTLNILKTCLCLGVAFICMQGTAFAQTTSENTDTPTSTNTYPLSYFTQYSPRTASDMVARIPGFTINRRNNNARGLGQGGANVLINGARISGKSNDAQSVLGRIPASSVLSIEILDGASLDIPGLSGKVVNVTTSNTGLTGSWRYTAELQNRSRANLLGFEVSITDTKGPFEYTLSAKNDGFRNNAPGPEDAFDANGVRTEHRDEHVFFFGDRPSVSTDITYTPANGHIGHINGQYELFNFRNEDQSRVTAITSAGENGERNNANSEDEWNMEIGADYAFDIGPGNLKLIAIKRHEDSTNGSIYKEFIEATTPYQSNYSQITLEGESIGRAEYAMAQGETHDWQISAEGAFNFLDRTSVLTASDKALPELAASRVEEKRAEASLTHGWKVSDTFNLQASASLEYSQLAQTGQAGKTREFVRPKGFLSASYSPTESFSIKSKVERRVGQLNFNTFVSSVNLSEDLKNSGNPDIVPPEFWAANIEFEKQWGDDFTGSLKFYGRKFENFVDRIAVNGGDAPGNIDKASLWGVHFISTVKFDRIGVEGLQLTSDLQARNTYIIDPFTNVERRISGNLVSRYKFDLRHDIPDTDLAWSLFVESDRRSANYRFDRTDHFRRGQPFVAVNLIHKNVFGLKVSAYVRNALSQDNNFTRNFWDGSRANDVFKGYELRVRNQPARFGINISGTI